MLQVLLYKVAVNMTLECFRLERHVLVQLMASEFGSIKCLNFCRLIWRPRTRERPLFLCSKTAGELIVIQSPALRTQNLRKILIILFRKLKRINTSQNSDTVNKRKCLIPRQYFVLLGCDAASLGNQLPIFQWNIFISSLKH